MQLLVEGIQLSLLTINIFRMNSPSHLATPPTGGVISIGVPIAVVGLVLTGAVVVILIACVVWRYIRSRKKFFPVSIFVVTRIGNTVYPLFHAVY